MNLNIVTVSALLSWPLISLWLYKTRTLSQATLWTILVGYMVLPEGAYIKLPMLPQLDKSSIPNIAALIGCMIASATPIRFWKGFGLAEILILILLCSPFITSELNNDPIVVGAVALPGVGAYDAISAVIAQIMVLIPFVLGRWLLTRENNTEQILRILVIAGLVYTIPALFEVRMSPQLHNWIYGYYPFHLFDEQMRSGGFRPVVFMRHGLLVAFFFMTTAVAAAAFWRNGKPVIPQSPIPSSCVTAYLSGVLMLCKTASAFVYGLILVLLVRFTKPKLQMKIASAMVIIALLYPTLRAADLVPTSAMLDLAGSFSQDRRDSLQSRFTNENQILDRAADRFWFGWGRWGRSFSYDEWGNQLTLPDGRWTITMGQFGLIGFLAEFGLLAFPVLRLASAFRFALSEDDKVFLAALALILAINLADLVPNDSLRPWTWLIAGSLLGRAETLGVLARQKRRLLKSGPLQTNARP